MAKITMEMFLNEIVRLKAEYKHDGHPWMELKSGDLQKMVAGKTNYAPMSCEAMYRSMGVSDEIIQMPMSMDISREVKHGNTLIVRYYL
jgi:hypothetical protein